MLRTVSFVVFGEIVHEKNVVRTAAYGRGCGDAAFIGDTVETRAYRLRDCVGVAFGTSRLAVSQKARARFETEWWFFGYDGFSAIEARFLYPRRGCRFIHPRQGAALCAAPRRQRGAGKTGGAGAFLRGGHEKRPDEHDDRLHPHRVRPGYAPKKSGTGENGRIYQNPCEEEVSLPLWGRWQPKADG